MFALAYVILPFTELDPSEAIRTSLARFERGVRGEIPPDWVEFDDYSGDLMSAYREQFTFSLGEDEGLQIVASPYATMCVEPEKVRKEMKRRGFENWQVRFAETMDFDDFYDLFCKELQRNPKTGAYGQWRNLLGHWELGLVGPGGMF